MSISKKDSDQIKVLALTNIRLLDHTPFKKLFSQILIVSQLNYYLNRTCNLNEFKLTAINLIVNIRKSNKHLNENNSNCVF